MKRRLKTTVSKLKVFVQDRWKVLIVVAIVLIGLGLYISSKQQKGKVEVTTVNPEYKTLTKTLDVSGVVDAKEKARLRFLAGGKVVYLGAKEGDAVKKWQTIATIDQATLEKQLQQTMNNYLKERWDWEELRDTTVENSDGTTRVVPDLSTRRTVDKAQWDLDNSVLNVEIADIAIQNTRMISPINGILVTAPTAVAGTQLAATDVFEVVNPDTLVFRAAVDEIDIASVKPNQTAEIELDAYPDVFIDSNVNYISYTSVQTTTGTVFVVDFPIASTSGSLDHYRLGMNGDVSIKLEEKPNVLVIPIEATRESDGKMYVDIQTDDGKTEAREITPGLETDEEIEVVDGLTTADRVVVPS